MVMLMNWCSSSESVKREPDNTSFLARSWVQDASSRAPRSAGYFLKKFKVVDRVSHSTHSSISRVTSFYKININIERSVCSYISGFN